MKRSSLKEPLSSQSLFCLQCLVTLTYHVLPHTQNLRYNTKQSWIQYQRSTHSTEIIALVGPASSFHCQVYQVSIENRHTWLLPDILIIIPNKFQTFQLLRKEAENTFIAAKSTKWNSGNLGCFLVDNSSGEKNLEYDLELGTWNLEFGLCLEIMPWLGCCWWRRGDVAAIRRNSECDAPRPPSLPGGGEAHQTFLERFQRRTSYM